MLWLQGLEAAPPVVVASYSSWQRLNPGYSVHLLTAESLKCFIPPSDLHRIMGREKEREALSDEIRLELLVRYGGIWADATTLCTRPLEEWLPSYMQTGFFAFDKPGSDRMLSTWFLAATKGNAVIEKWRQASIEYWRTRTVRDDYFWCHQLFAKIYETEPDVQLMWDLTPKISARHAFHFGPQSPALLANTPEGLQGVLNDPPVGVFKLTHKLAELPAKNSLFSALVEFGCGGETGAKEPWKAAGAGLRVLVAWYGSFPDHGTIGDLRAFEAVVTHLVGRGLSVDHASAEVEVHGATRVVWEAAQPTDYVAVIFVCGPILKSHRLTRSLFDHFASVPMIGLSVSMFDETNCEYFNPFDIVLARQGMAERYGDVAIAAPPVDLPSRAPESADDVAVIGLVLRGPQGEYGSERCLAEETRAVFDDVVARLRMVCNARVQVIENHLERSKVAPVEIDAAYRGVDLVLTTRFHGAVLAMRYGKPFIAVDQIRGGAKVYDLLKPLGWPHIGKIREVSAGMLATAAKSLVAKTSELQLSMARNQAVIDANRTLDALDSAIAMLQGCRE